MGDGLIRPPPFSQELMAMLETYVELCMVSGRGVTLFSGIGTGELSFLK